MYHNTIPISVYFFGSMTQALPRLLTIVTSSLSELCVLQIGHDDYASLTSKLAWEKKQILTMESAAPSRKISSFSRKVVKNLMAQKLNTNSKLIIINSPRAED